MNPPSLPEGVTLVPQWLSEAEEKDLLATYPLEAAAYAEVKIASYDVVMLRRKVWEGDLSTVQGRRAQPYYWFPGVEGMPPQRPWSPVLLRLRDRIHAECGVYCHQAILTFYKDGNVPIGFHQDKHRDIFFDVSLGATRTILFSTTQAQRDKVAAVPLEARSLLTVSKRANDRFYHGIAKEARRGPRLSIVFRPLPQWACSTCFDLLTQCRCAHGG